MFKIIVIFLLLCLSISIIKARELILITDVDDTIKQTHVLNYFSGGPFISNDFFGLSQLYRSLINYNNETNARNRTSNQVNMASVYYISGAPGFLNIPGKLMVETQSFPEGVIHNRPNLKVSTKDFKIDQIKKILERLNGDKEFDVILVGDNGEKDIEVYDEIVKTFETYSNLTFHVYIHMVYGTAEKSKEQGKNTKDGQTPFLTAVDLALDLYSKELIGAKDLANMKIVLDELDSNFTSVIPRWVQCQEFVENYELPRFPAKIKAPQKLLNLDLYRKSVSEICSGLPYRDEIEGYWLF